MNTITLTDHIGETLTIPADANGATTATWGDLECPDLTANAWYYPNEGVLFIPADCQGREDDTINPETCEAIGQWVEATSGVAAVILDGAPRSWIATHTNRGGRPPIGDAIKLKLPPEMLARIDTAAANARCSRSEWIRRACLERLAASR